MSINLITIETRPGFCWLPVYTKARCEKVVDEYCTRHGIPCYLPLLHEAKRYQRRTVKTLIPMFKGYVFVQLGDETREEFLRCHKIVQILRVTELQESVLVEELCSVQQMEHVQDEAELTVLPELKQGVAVVVRDGPLQGMRGIVERRKNRVKVYVNIEILGQSAVTEMDVGELDVEP